MFKIKFFQKFLINITKFVKDEEGSSTIESGLLIALSMILFLLLIGIAQNIYAWIESTVFDSLNFSFLR
jgi:Flp pilus assembly pilin Flp